MRIAVPKRCRRVGRVPRRAAFTLIETALTTIIVGVGVLALMASQQAFHQKNRWSSQASVALQLGNEIRELSLNLPRHDPVTGTEFWGPEPGELFVGDFDDLDDFDGFVFSSIAVEGQTDNGPINARREIIANMPGWEQEITVTNVDPFDITSGATDASTNTVRIEVVVRYQGPLDSAPIEMTRVSWVSPN